ncbi:DUF3558 family protein, partial [Klebsiella pneumoniae]|uniref:DUF3558 family protein n=1 Tax=Klebsiella pneumoniae TaxID=573 RepID=UPI003013F5C7
DYLYGLDVISSIDHTIDDARSREGNQGIRDLEVGGRDAFMYTTKTGASLSDCNIALKMSSGVAVFTVVNHSEDRVDACEKAELHVNDLESS